MITSTTMKLLNNVHLTGVSAICLNRLIYRALLNISVRVVVNYRVFGKMTIHF